MRLRDLLGPVVGLKRSLAQVFILALALQAIAVVTPFYMQWAVDGAVVSADRDLLTVLGLGFLMLAVVQVSLTALRSWVVLYLSTNLNLQWLASVFTHLLRLARELVREAPPGRRRVAIRRREQHPAHDDLELRRSADRRRDGRSSRLAMMIVYSPPLTLIAASAVSGLRTACAGPSTIRCRRATEEHIVHTAKQQSHFLETVRGVQSIKLFGRQEERRSRWLNLVVDAVNQDLVAQKLGLGFRSANGLVFGVERIAIVWLGALLILDGGFSVGMLFAFMAYKDQFSARVAGLIDKGIEMRMLSLQADRLADIVLTAPEQEAGSMPADPIDASLEVASLSFRYSEMEPFVLLNCSLAVAPGESVAVVGPSGGGKTTLVKLMLGLLAPTDGKILVGGIDIQKLGIDRYRKLVGTVMQDDQLFAGSIGDNISFFDPVPDQSAIEHYARLAAVHDDIAAMPMAYNTLIGDMGAALSGGQKQRILLARALYKQPRILFLDEATSALDVQKEKAVNDAIRALRLTRIIIAHRPETIASAERVIVLQGGRVAQDLKRVVAGSI